MSRGLFKRARLGCALLCLCLPPLAAASDDCIPERFDETVIVDHVYDGDTVRLTDGRRLRLIGLDTPEIFHDGRKAEPFAKAARSALVALLAQSGHQLHLAYDRERIDKYGRTLAHAYIVNGQPLSVGIELLVKGYAKTLFVPPNDRFAGCYRAAESRAREARAGLWGSTRRLQRVE